MYLSPKFVPTVLGHPYLTPRQCWQLLSPQLRLTEDSESGNKPLLQWLRAACTIGPGGDPANLSEIPHYPFPPDRGLDDHMSRALSADLPGLYSAAATTVMPGTREVVGAINSLTEEQRATREEASTRQARSAEKSPATYYGSATVVLNRLTHTHSISELPEVYQLISASTKKTERLILQEALHNSARELGIPAYAPIATPELTKKLTTANLTHDDPDDFSQGVQPFITGFRTVAERNQLNTHIGAYDTLVSGTGAGLQDIFKIKESEKISLPTSILQATYSLKSFKVLLHALLGDLHPLVRGYHQFICSWDSHLMELEAEGSTDLLAPAKLVRWVQIRVSLWFQRQYRTSESVPSPNFIELFDLIQEMREWKPPIPQRYLASSPGSYSAAASASASAATLASASASASAASATKGNQSASTGSGTAAGGRRERITAESYLESEFAEFKNSGLSMRAVRDAAIAAEKPVPINSKGTEMCLSYHVLGFCWNNCHRAEDHRAHSASETNKLKAWCTECYKEGGPL